jgi:hypothetical protein
VSVLPILFLVLNPDLWVLMPGVGSCIPVWVAGLGSRVGVGCFFLFSGSCLSGCDEFLLVAMNSGPVRLGFMRIQGP